MIPFSANKRIAKTEDEKLMAYKRSSKTKTESITVKHPYVPRHHTLYERMSFCLSIHEKQKKQKTENRSKIRNKNKRVKAAVGAYPRTPSMRRRENVEFSRERERGKGLERGGVRGEGLKGRFYSEVAASFRRGPRAFLSAKTKKMDLPYHPLVNKEKFI